MWIDGLTECAERRIYGVTELRIYGNTETRIYGTKELRRPLRLSFQQLLWGNRYNFVEGDAIRA